jgi:hypothetical protein
MAVAAEAIAQLDVFDDAAEVLFVEPAQLAERDPSDGATPGPERGRFRITFLMDEVMEKVPVL